MAWVESDASLTLQPGLFINAKQIPCDVSPDFSLLPRSVLISAAYDARLDNLLRQTDS